MIKKIIIGVSIIFFLSFFLGGHGVKPHTIIYNNFIEGAFLLKPINIDKISDNGKELQVDSVEKFISFVPRDSQIYIDVDKMDDFVLVKKYYFFTKEAFGNIVYEEKYSYDGLDISHFDDQSVTFGEEMTKYEGFVLFLAVVVIGGFLIAISLLTNS